MINIVAKKNLSYGGRRRKAGDTFPATPKHAKLLIAVGKARMPSEEDADSVAKNATPQDEPVVTGNADSEVSEQDTAGDDADQNGEDSEAAEETVGDEAEQEGQAVEERAEEKPGDTDRARDKVDAGRKGKKGKRSGKNGYDTRAMTADGSAD